MTQVAGTVAFVLATWLLLFAVFVGIGSLLRAPFAGKLHSGDDVYSCFWLGWCIAVALLQVWHLWLPIDWRPLAVCSLLGSLGLLLSGPRRLISLLRREVRPQSSLGGALLAVWTASKATGPVGPYDAGLYHVPTVLWSNAHPVVAGLANLHHRLGFNSSHFLYVSMVNVGPWAETSYHVATSLLLAVLLLQILGYVSSWRGQGLASFDRFKVHLAGLFLLPTIIFGQAAGWATASNDVPIYVLEVLSFWKLADILSDDAGSATRRLDLFALLFVLAVAITIKPNAVLFALPAWIVAAGVVMRGSSVRAAACLLWPGVLAAVLVIGVWIWRGILLSGYPFFPLPLLGVPVEWGFPRDDLSTIVPEIRAFAQDPDLAIAGQVQGLNWLVPWFHREHRWVTLPALLAIGATFVALRIGGATVPRRYWLLLVPPFVGLAVWFWSAPHPRFAFALLWCVGLLPLALCLPLVGPRGSGLAVILLNVALLATLDPRFAAQLARPVLRPFPAMPAPELREHRTDAGLVVFVPIQGDQVWGGPLLASPEADRRLRLRCPNDIRCGFVKR